MANHVAQCTFPLYQCRQYASRPLLSCADNSIQRWFASRDPSLTISHLFPRHFQEKFLLLTFLSRDAALDTQRLSDAREAAVQHSAVLEYELRLAKEDIASLQDIISKQAEAAVTSPTPGKLSFLETTPR